jgi:hypothetical protein
VADKPSEQAAYLSFFPETLNLFFLSRVHSWTLLVPSQQREPPNSATEYADAPLVTWLASDPENHTRHTPTPYPEISNARRTNPPPQRPLTPRAPPARVRRISASASARTDLYASEASSSLLASALRHPTAPAPHRTPP